MKTRFITFLLLFFGSVFPASSTGASKDELVPPLPDIGYQLYTREYWGKRIIELFPTLIAQRKALSGNSSLMRHLDSLGIKSISIPKDPTDLTRYKDPRCIVAVTLQCGGKVVYEGICYGAGALVGIAIGQKNKDETMSLWELYVDEALLRVYNVKETYSESIALLYAEFSSGESSPLYGMMLDPHLFPEGGGRGSGLLQEEIYEIKFKNSKDRDLDIACYKCGKRLKPCKACVESCCTKVGRCIDFSCKVGRKGCAHMCCDGDEEKVKKDFDACCENCLLCSSCAVIAGAAGCCCMGAPYLLFKYLFS